jgi:dTDP-L-rhamnose 4-epimerase
MTDDHRTVLVTGSEGFIGRAVCVQLVRQGWRVLRSDSLEPRVHTGWPSTFPSELDCYGDAGGIGYGLLSQARVVVHLAAQVGVADSMTEPLRYVQGNTLSTARLLDTLAQVARRKPVRLIVASSMSVYGDPQTTEPVTEQHPVQPASVYGLTKYDQERLCLLWAEQYKQPCVALRFFNVYGPGQALHNPYTGVLANFAQRLLAGDPPIVYEDGAQTRDFVYVDDIAAGVVRAVEENATGVYNLCTGQPTTVLQAAEALATALGRDIAPTVTGTVRPGDIRHCIGDPRLARAMLGWEPAVSFADGIQRYGHTLLK